MNLIPCLPFLAAAALLTASCGKKPAADTAPPSPPAMEAAMRSWQYIESHQRQIFAREHFLSSVPVWEPDHARKIADLGHRYNVLQDKWTAGTLPPPILSNEETEKMARDMREIYDQLSDAFNQSGKLTPEGAKALEAWETRNWYGYFLPQDFYHDALPPRQSPPVTTPQEKAAADFRARRAAMAQPLIEALHKASPPPPKTKKTSPVHPPMLLPPPAAAGTDKPPPQEEPGISVASTLRLPELTTRNRAVMNALLNHCEESARLYAQWGAKNWEGYVSGGVP